MATKIITPGTDVYTATCTECGCRFSDERSDVHRNYVHGGERVGSTVRSPAAPLRCERHRVA